MHESHTCCTACTCSGTSPPPDRATGQDSGATGPAGLKLLFMSHSNELVSLHAALSVRPETIHLLVEMAQEMGASIDEVLSAIAEDAVADLEPPSLAQQVLIPASCSTADLMAVQKQAPLG